MEIELVRGRAGDLWFPWNYGRRSRSGRVDASRFEPDHGFIVLNALRGRRVLGSCALRVGYRHGQHVLGDEEYQYGTLGSGPAYFWEDDERCPWILVVKSFWVRPEERRNGIARAFAEYARTIGLPGYLGFANKSMEAFFDCEHRPTGQKSGFQQRFDLMLAGASDTSIPDEDADFTVHLQAEAPAMLLWDTWSNDQDEMTSLPKALFDSDRAGAWEIDSGEFFEASFTDSAFASDRSYGYVLAPWCDGWGPEEGPYEALPVTASDDDWDDARAAFARQISYAAGAVDGWILDADTMRAYASIRHFLRVLEWREFTSLDDAARELFVRDLRDEPRGLLRFSALMTPLKQL